MNDRALSVQVSRRIDDWCYWHWSYGFPVALLVSAFAVTFLARVVTALATILLASTVTTTLAVALLACIALATLAAIAAPVASEDAF